MNGFASVRFIQNLSRFPRKIGWIVMVALLGGLAAACQRLPQAKGPAANRAASKPFPLGIYGVPGVADLQAVHASGFSLVMGGLATGFQKKRDITESKHPPASSASKSSVSKSPIAFVLGRFTRGIVPCSIVFSA